MSLKCPKCQSGVIKKNGTIHNGKQKYECLSCHRQFVENPENKIECFFLIHQFFSFKYKCQLLYCSIE